MPSILVRRPRSLGTSRRCRATPSTAKWFRVHWGPVFYRGLLNGRARVLCVASDPGPTERIAGRTLVGDAGQRVQSFLAKLGLTRSYALVNAFAYALLPSKASQATRILAEPAHRAGATASSTWWPARTCRPSSPSGSRHRLL